MNVCNKKSVILRLQKIVMINIASELQQTFRLKNNQEDLLRNFLQWRIVSSFVHLYVIFNEK